jgi:hypothetical protein
VLELSLVLLWCAGVHQDVVNVGEAEVEPSWNIVHESLECLRGVAQAEWHERKFEQPKWCCDGCFLHVVRVHRDLMVGNDEFDC